jgi:hypothetical protein
VETHFEAFASDQTLKGMMIVGYKKAINSDEFAQYFERHGFADVDPNRWYLAQDLLDVFNDMLADAHGTLDFVSIGIAIAPNLGIPPTLDLHSPEQVFGFIGNAQAATTFTSHPGYIRSEQIDKTHYTIRARTVMPDDMIYGVMYAFARGFVPTGSHISLTYTPDGKRRDFGDEYTSMELKWE